MPKADEGRSAKHHNIPYSQHQRQSSKWETETQNFTRPHCRRAPPHTFSFAHLPPQLLVRFVMAAQLNDSLIR